MDPTDFLCSGSGAAALIVGHAISIATIRVVVVSVLILASSQELHRYRSWAASRLCSGDLPSESVPVIAPIQAPNNVMPATCSLHTLLQPATYETFGA